MNTTKLITVVLMAHFCQQANCVDAIVPCNITEDCGSDYIECDLE
jgi:Sulfite exporter TauE/SafE